MAQFINVHRSHEHSLNVLNLLYEHDTFMESISSMADMGSGSGLDAHWWASATTRDDPPESLNIHCYAVDNNPSVHIAEEHPMITKITGDFEKRVLSKQVDVIWCHDAFQYAVNPLNTLKLWNQQLNENGLMYIGLPMHNYKQNGQMFHTSTHYEYFPHTPLSMIYMLALNGFDCKDGYLRKAPNDPWFHIAVFKTDIEPMDPRTTSWHDLAEKGLLHDSIVNSLHRHDAPHIEDLLFTWLDKENYRLVV
jgi:SAM-dependent methyltransferase